MKLGPSGVIKDADRDLGSRRHKLKLKQSVHATSETPPEFSIPKRSLPSYLGLEKSGGSPASGKIIRENNLAVS